MSIINGNAIVDRETVLSAAKQLEADLTLNFTTFVNVEVLPFSDKVNETINNLKGDTNV